MQGSLEVLDTAAGSEASRPSSSESDHGSLHALASSATPKLQTAAGKLPTQSHNNPPQSQAPQELLLQRSQQPAAQGQKSSLLQAKADASFTDPSQSSPVTAVQASHPNTLPLVKPSGSAGLQARQRSDEDGAPEQRSDLLNSLPGEFERLRQYPSYARVLRDTSVVEAEPAHGAHQVHFITSQHGLRGDSLQKAIDSAVVSKASTAAVIAPAPAPSRQHTDTPDPATTTTTAASAGTIEGSLSREATQQAGAAPQPTVGGSVQAPGGNTPKQRRAVLEADGAAPAARVPAHTSARPRAQHKKAALAPAILPGGDADGPPGAASPARVPLLTILAMTMAMAMMSGFGALPFLVFGRLGAYWSGLANAAACGVMLAASFGLLEESKSHSTVLVMGGMLGGVAAMKLSTAYLSRFEDMSFQHLKGADARKALLIIGVMAAHAFGEGSGVGVSFAGPRGWAQGTLVTLAIGLHNIPEGMAALYWTLLSALPQGLVALPSYMFVEAVSGILPVALGFAAGCMIYIVFAELIPDALEETDHSHVAMAATASAAWLQGLSMAMASLERPDGSLASPIQADLPSLLPQLATLLPSILLVPCAAAATSCILLRSLPVTVGATAGAGGWLAWGSLLTLLTYPGPQPVGTTLTCAGIGAAVALALWQAMPGVAAVVVGGGEGGASGEGGEEGMEVWGGGVASGQQQQQQLVVAKGGGGLRGPQDQLQLQLQLQGMNGEVSVK
ncbi:MAG: hypothetical protein WDW36_000510 [Sanguina aurantia]